MPSVERLRAAGCQTSASPATGSRAADVTRTVRVIREPAPRVAHEFESHLGALEQKQRVVMVGVIDGDGGASVPANEDVMNGASGSRVFVASASREPVRCHRGLVCTVLHQLCVASERRADPACALCPGRGLTPSWAPASRNMPNSGSDPELAPTWRLRLSVRTPRASRAGEQDAPQTRLSTAASAITQRPAVERAGDVAQRTERERGERADAVADPEHHPDDARDLLGAVGGVERQRHHQREDRAVAAAGHARPEQRVRRDRARSRSHPPHRRRTAGRAACAATSGSGRRRASRGPT